MRRSAFKTALVFVIIFSLTVCQLTPSLAASNDNRRAAFAGIYFENVPPDIQEILLWRITGILETQSSFVLTKPNAVQLQYGQVKTAAFLRQQNAEAFADLARELQLDHVFSGALANRSTDNSRILLVGQLHRYDHKAGQVKTFEINHDYEQFGNALIAFKERYVDNLPAAKDAKSKVWSRVLAGGAIIAGVVAITLMIGGAGGGAGEENRPPKEDN
ncbi:hypothetical protein L0337_43775 [candidate division KSB1 bacterium]|nr:hypothetical protein [candidate division KSB1 bacterium]